jgi:SAM-dependent methyltransferase
MSHFQQYSRYYNLLYKEKDYQGEVDYIDSLIREYAPSQTDRLLDIGSGTGNHDLLLTQKGYEVTGVDLSEEMLKVARTRANGNGKLRFFQGNAVDFNLNDTFDCVVSLFHVMSYQTTNRDLIGLAKNAYRHLKKDGLFIFDYWYGPTGQSFELKGLKMRRSAW